MSKKEFIKLLETLEFEELRCATISYYKKKPSQYSTFDEDCKPKTICIGTDLERLINEYFENNRHQTTEIYRKISDLENKINGDKNAE